MAQFSNHSKILLTKPTTRIQEAKLVERPRHVRRSLRKREVGDVQVSQPHLITVFLLCNVGSLCISQLKARLPDRLPWVPEAFSRSYYTPLMRPTSLLAKRAAREPLVPRIMIGSARVRSLFAGSFPEQRLVIEPNPPTHGTCREIAGI